MLEPLANSLEAYSARAQPRPVIWMEGLAVAWFGAESACFVSAPSAWLCMALVGAVACDGYNGQARLFACRAFLLEGDSPTRAAACSSPRLPNPLLQV
jgi:hypothetical protein